MKPIKFTAQQIKEAGLQEIPQTNGSAIVLNVNANGEVTSDHDKARGMLDMLTDGLGRIFTKAIKPFLGGHNFKVTIERL